MSGKSLRIALVALAAVVVGWWLVSWYTRPERRIERNLREIQKLVAKAPGESNLTALAKARSLSELFVDGFEFVAEQFDFHTRDRQRLVSGVHQYRSRSQTILMSVRDREIFVDPVHRRATSHLTADFITKARDITGREAYRFQVNWVEVEGDWRIDYVRLLEIIEEPPRAWIP